MQNFIRTLKARLKTLADYIKPCPAFGRYTYHGMHIGMMLDIPFSGQRVTSVFP
jgi:hypothetical protein